jgi:curved DNA-binding protein CbpA
MLEDRMGAHSTDFYALLGVAPTASVVEIRRAYRRRLVISHRERVLDLTDHLEHLRRAYATLRDPTLRRDYDLVIRPGPTTRGNSRPPTRSNAPLHSPREIALEMGRHSQRLGAAAVEQSADTVSRLAGEHDAREIASARSRARRALFARPAKLFVLFALVGAAWLAARWLARG